MERNISRGLGKYSHVLLSATFGIVAIAEAVRLGLKFEGEDFISGPGGYMMVVGAFLILFALIGTAAVLVGLRRSGEPGRTVKIDTGSAASSEAPADAARIRKSIFSFVFCVLYVLLIQFLGFTIASLFYLAGNLWLLQNPLRRIVLTCVFMFPILAFGLPLIGMSVPKGVFGI